VVEDDPAVQKALKRMLQIEGFAVDSQSDGLAALSSFHSHVPSAVILDLRLPNLSGRDLCRQMKAAAPSVPIIILSASNDESDKVLLLELGADDYVTKPFSPRELFARLRVALRHCNQPDLPNLISFDSVAVDLRRMEVTRDIRPVILTQREFRTLRFLVQNSDRVVTRTELSKEVCEYVEGSATLAVDNHIMSLRHKLERDPGNPTHFRTVRCVGYRFVF
jgi:DNA-binding response OmpR family regulator